MQRSTERSMLGSAMKKNSGANMYFAQTPGSEKNASRFPAGDRPATITGNRKVNVMTIVVRIGVLKSSFVISPTRRCNSKNGPPCMSRSLRSVEAGLSRAPAPVESP